jgi:hypothetical protein
MIVIVLPTAWRDIEVVKKFSRPRTQQKILEAETKRVEGCDLAHTGGISGVYHRHFQCKKTASTVG